MNVDIDHILDFREALSLPLISALFIIGANSVARALGEAPQSHGFYTLLTDTGNVRTARMAGLRAFYGNPVSEYAERTLDSEKSGGEEFPAACNAGLLPLFALTPNERLPVFKVDAGIKPGPGWTIISLIKKPAGTNENGQQAALGRNGGGKSQELRWCRHE